MPLFERHFTLAEAREELPWLVEQLHRIRELLEELRLQQADMERIQQLIRSNGHGAKHVDFGTRISEIQSITEAIQQKGIEIKDLERGLIDFPHLRDGEEVYLCWLFGEPDIGFWHSISDGFQGRQPL